MFNLIVFFIVAVTTCSAQSSCTTPSGAIGECKALRKCPPLLDIRNKAIVTEADEQLLKDSKCTNPARSSNKKIRFVCCPLQTPDVSCITPGGEMGKCVNISSCEHLSRMLEIQPVPKETVDFMKRSRCEGAAPFSVCCQPKPTEAITTVRPTSTIKSPIIGRSIGPNVGSRSSAGVCSTPDGKPGRCVNISSCDHLSAMLYQKPLPETAVNFVRRSRCQGTTHFAVCCPDQVEERTVSVKERTPSSPTETSDNDTPFCLTPEQKAGRCVNISACDHFVKMFQNMPLSPQDYNYLKNSRCQGAYHLSVCCGPKPTGAESRSIGSSAAPATESVVAYVATVPSVTKAPSCQEQNSAYPPDINSGCCGRDSHLTPKIMGGNVTDIEEYPWLVLMQYSSRTPKTCGGSLISGKYVLTAAHCVSGRHLRGDNVTHVIVGEFDRTKDGPDCVPVEAGAMDCTDGEMRVEVDKIILHPDGQDIALIRLKELVPFTFFYRPICLPTSDVTLSLPNPFRLIVAGWGVTENKTVSQIKMAVELPYVDITQCQSSLLIEWQKICRNRESTPVCQAIRAKIYQEHMICAGGLEDKDSCSGDSGGPLMYERGRTFEAIGVLSVGSTPCAQANHPAMYVKVYDNLEWIRSNIEPYAVFLLNEPYSLCEKVYLQTSPKMIMFLPHNSQLGERIKKNVVWE